MRNKPLTHEEIADAQRKFNILLADPDSAKRVDKLLTLQETIEMCEEVDMTVEIVGGIPFEYWCNSCKRKYSRMYTLLDIWYKQAIKNIHTRNRRISRRDMGL